MAKTKQINFTVVLNPQYDNRIMSQSIIDHIKRHIDDVKNVRINCDTVCIYCECIWEDEWDDSKPQCCNKAAAVWQKEEDERNLNDIQGI